MALKVLYDKIEKKNGYTYYLQNPNQLFKINFNRNEWLISFSFESKEKRYKQIGTIKPNSIKNLIEREKQWHDIILHIFDLYINDYNSFVDFIHNKKDNRNLLLSTISSDYLEFISLTKKNSTYTKYSGSNRVFRRLFETYTISDLKPQNKPLIAEKINKELNNYSAKQYNELVSYFSRVISYLNANLSTYELEKEMYNPFQFDMKHKKKQVKKSDLHRLFTDTDYYSIRNYIVANKMVMLDLAISLIYDCHLRISELQKIKIKHIDQNKGTITLYNSDTKVQSRICQLSKDTIIKLTTIISNHTDKELYIFGYKALFCQTKPLGDTYLSEKFSEVKTTLKLDKNYTLYGFKHYSNSIKYQKLKSKNVPYSQIISILMTLNGHTNATTTEVYLRDILAIHDDSTTELMTYLFE